MKQIVVIGGGPAGLSAALEGVKNGFEVILYEKNKVGEHIRCAEGFFDTLNMLGEPKHGVKYKVKEILVQLKSCYPFVCDKNLNIWMMDKGEWLKGLADEARGLGVNIIDTLDYNGLERIVRIMSDNRIFKVAYSDLFNGNRFMGILQLALAHVCHSKHA